MELLNRETKAVEANIAGFWEYKEVDATKFVKLFVNGVKALKELSSAGTKVFEVLYLSVQNQVNKDQVYLSYNIVDQVTNPMSETTYSRGMKELINKEFIAATPNIGLFWINPLYIWNGDRLAFVHEYKMTRLKKIL